METESTKTKLDKIASKKSSTWLEKAKWREANEAWLDKSASIALKVVRTLRAMSMTQRDLAERLGVSAQQVNKILKGKENLTLETISKLEYALCIQLITIPAFYSNIVFDMDSIKTFYAPITTHIISKTHKEYVEVDQLSTYSTSTDPEDQYKKQAA